MKPYTWQEMSEHLDRLEQSIHAWNLPITHEQRIVNVVSVPHTERRTNYKASNYQLYAEIETQTFVDQLCRTFPLPNGCRIEINYHGYTKYPTLELVYSDLVGRDWAIRIDNNHPRCWDDIARRNLIVSGVTNPQIAWLS